MFHSEQVRKAIRHSIKTNVEFFVDADILEAESIDISETGIRIETDHPIKVKMRIDMGDGRYEETDATLIWAEANHKKGMTYGLSFDEEEEEGGKEINHPEAQDATGEWE